MSNALDELLADFAAHSTAATPAVNPPESAKVLAAQTAPEVAGKPEPVAATEAAPAPTEKPAEVVAAEQAKRKRRTKAEIQADSAADAALTAPAERHPMTAPDLTTEQLCAELRGRGYLVQLQWA